jgi:transposase-like protein
MADQADQVSTTGLVNTKQRPGAPKRRQYSEAFKRQMVAETQVPGASVSTVARRHDVNSNQLFRWRRQLLPKAVVESGAMVPVWSSGSPAAFYLWRAVDDEGEVLELLGSAPKG